MSRLRQQAGKVQAQGAIERRDWNPSLDSSHYKVYRWWLRKSGKRRSRENFCHYWRVVVLWAPLRAMAIPAIVLLGVVVVIGLGIFAFTQFSIVLGMLLLMALIGYIVLGIFVAGHLLSEIDEGLAPFKWEWLSGSPKVVLALLCFMTSPVLAVLATLLLTVGSFAAILMLLHEDYDLYRKSGRWIIQAHISDRKPLAWVRPWLTAPLALIVLSFWFPIALFALLVIGWVLMVTGLFLGVSYLSDRANEKRKDQRMQQMLDEEAIRDARWQATKLYLVRHRLFPILHPEWAGNEYMYQQWFSRYEKYCQSIFHDGPANLSLYSQFRWTLGRYRALYGEGIDDFRRSTCDGNAVAVVSRPNKARRIASGTGDFFILAWSFVLAKKWKICPLVELPE